MSDILRAANATLLRRYLDLCEDAGEVGSGDTGTIHLAWMARTALERLGANPHDKTSRWIGYIQGCLICHGLTTTTAERDFSRPLFHAVYTDAGMAIPPTLERPNP